MRFIKTFKIFEKESTSDIITIAGKKIDISNLDSEQKKEIQNILEIDPKMPEEEVLNLIDIYLLSIS